MSKLANIKRGRIQSALRYLVYGTEGIGKTSFAALAPEPIFLDLEDGTGLIDCARYSFRSGPGGHVAQSYSEVLDAIDDLTKAKHAFKTVVIDTLDRLEPLVWEHVCKRDGKEGGIESYGYGKGYQIAVDEWRIFCRRLDNLRAKGVSVVLLGHAQIRRFSNPEGDDFDRYSLRVNEKAGGLLREWCDVLGFCCFEGGASKRSASKWSGDKIVGYATGKRIIHFQRDAAYDAKSRIHLPVAMDLANNPWPRIAFGTEVAREEVTPERLGELIGAEIKRIGDGDLEKKVTEACEKECDVEVLIAYLTNLRARAANSTKGDTQ